MGVGFGESVLTFMVGDLFLRCNMKNALALRGVRVYWAVMAALLLCTCNVMAQNHLPNPSYEVNTGCPTFVTQLANATPWEIPAGHGGSPDYIHVCGTNPWVQVPNNAFGSQMPATGDAYIGFCLYYQSFANFREYAYVPLTQPLVAGTTYRMEVNYSLADNSMFATDKLQFYFSNAAPTWPGGGMGPMTTLVPQTMIPTGTYLTDKVNWVAVGANYTAVGGETHVTIGNFLDDANTPTISVPGGNDAFCFIYLDDVSLVPINVATASADTSICPGTCAELWANGAGPYTWTTTTNPTPFATTDTVVVCPTVTTSYIVTGTSFIDTVTVTVLPPAPTVGLGNDTTICVGQSVVLNAGTQTGNTILWNPGGASTQTITVNASGEYEVVVSNVCGADSDSVVVTVAPLPVPALGADVELCAGASQVLNPGAGFAGYAWSTGSTASTITVSTSGTYSVTVTSGDGCEAADTVVVSVALPLSAVTSGVGVTCFGGSNGSAAVLATGTGPFDYVWSAPGNPTTAAIAGLAAGTYTVTVTDDYGCTTTAQVTISQPNAVVVTTFGTGESCPGRNDGVANATASGGVLPYNFQWSNGQSGQMIDSLSPGTYTVVVTDGNGCTSNGTYTVVAGIGVTVVTSGNPAFCEGEGGDTVFASAGGANGPFYYQWWCSATLGNCGLDSIFDNDPIANPTQSGWYYVQATDQTGCQSTPDSIYVTVLPKPIVDAGPDQFICGDSAPCVVLTPTISGAPGPYTPLWMPATGLNNPNIMNPCARPDTTTIYTLVVQGGNGCQSEFTTTDTLATVTVHVNPIPVADAGVDKDICLGDSVMLQAVGHGAGPVYDFEWSPSTGLNNPLIINPKASPPSTTTYTLVVWSNGCPSYGDPVQVRVHTQPTVDAGPARDLCYGDSVLIDAKAGGDSTASYSFLWWPAAGLDNPVLEDPTVSPGATGWYFVQATSNYGCGESLDSVLLSIRPTPVAEAGMNLQLCLGDSVQLQGSYSWATAETAPASQVQLNWVPGVNMSDPQVAQPWLVPTVSGVYALNATVGLCSTVDSVLVTVTPYPEITLTADTTVACEGDTIHLSAVGGIGGVIYTWSPAAGLGNPGSGETTALPDSSVTYTVIANESGCRDTASIDLRIIPQPKAEFLHSETHGCAPLPVHFTEVSGDGIFRTWFLGDGSAISNDNSFGHVFEVPGRYGVSLQVVGEGGCTGVSDTAWIEVAGAPVAAFVSDPEAPASLNLLEGIVHFENLTTGAVGYAWSLGDGNSSTAVSPVHTYRAEGTYYVTLTATSAEGCVSSVVHGPYVIVAPDLFIPNVFSPNGDGVNDVFLVEYLGSQPFQMDVFDRWGVRMYTSNHRVDGWDGRNGNGVAVPDGVYFYTVRVGDREYVGNVTVVR